MPNSCKPYIVHHKQYNSPLDQNTKVDHQIYWCNLCICRQTKEALLTVNPGLSRKLTLLRFLTGARTSDALVNEHFFTLGVTGNPKLSMRAGGRNSHVIKACPGMAEYRQDTSGHQGHHQKTSATWSVYYTSWRNRSAEIMPPRQTGALKSSSCSNPDREFKNWAQYHTLFHNFRNKWVQSSLLINIYIYNTYVYNI